MSLLRLKKTSYYTFIFLICSLLAQAQKTEQVSLSLDGTWAFKTDPTDVGEQENWFKHDFAANGWETMNTPSNWDTQNEYANYVGKAWYRKTISIPAAWKDKTIFLNFEGVYFDSKVWVNGQLIGTNNNGFLPFEFDVSKLIHTNSINTIVVGTSNVFRLGAVWNWGGIRRPVKLVAGNAVRILQQHITPTVNLSKNTAAVGVKVFLQNSADKEQTVQGKVILQSPNLYHKEISFSVIIPANSKKEVNLNATLKKEQVHLWHFDDPYLYDCSVSLFNGEVLLQEQHKRFGIRKIEVDNKNYMFKLNGESVRLMGFNLVADDRTTGNTLPLWRVKEDVDMMKEIGCNMTRITHLPLTEEMYDYLDEKGMLIFPEVSLWGNSQNVDPDQSMSKEWLEKMIYNNYSHPSIIGWSVGNEIGENPKVMSYVESAIKLSKSIDSNHLAVMVSHTADRSIDPIQYSALGLINKYGENLAPVTEKIHQLHPEKLLFYTEYGIGQLSEDLDANFDAKAVLDSIRHKPYLMGASLWTFNDYRSSFNGTKEFSENRPWGIVDVFRQKKKAWYSIRKEYAPIQAIQIENIKNNAVGKSSAEIILTPRTKFDLPAYTMNNYRLVWNVKNDMGEVTNAGFENLTQIEPGDKVLKKVIHWNKAENISSLQIELVSGLDYSLCDTILFFNKPKTPEVIQITGARTRLNSAPGNTGTIRLVFNKDQTATAYKARYGKETLTNETPLTINHYIDIKGLEAGSTYKVTLSAVNSTGESEPTKIHEIPINYALAAPVIRYMEPAHKGLFIGYSTLPDDYIFQVQHTTKAGDYENAKTIQSTNKGVLFVPDLVNGQKYYYRIKSLKENLFPSLWSEERMVIPDGGQLAAVPKLNFIIQKGDEAHILFEPVKKAIGYVLQYKQLAAKNWESINITAAQIRHFHVSGLSKGKKYDFKLSAKNENGQSSFTTVRQSQLQE
ncbi:sugar-binding domain-containing protein [Pedobacter immunditicola]|uniref:sugar-binding domain-containing protein n=1 Tax=Pedobacter immunditicola TaxID=3133440 RepID=UPI0030A1F233